jgi:hypothetical protein
MGGKESNVSKKRAEEKPSLEASTGSIIKNRQVSRMEENPVRATSDYIIEEEGVNGQEKGSQRQHTRHLPRTHASPRKSVFHQKCKIPRIDWHLARGL